MDEIAYQQSHVGDNSFDDDFNYQTVDNKYSVSFQQHNFHSSGQ